MIVLNDEQKPAEIAESAVTLWRTAGGYFALALLVRNDYDGALRWVCHRLIGDCASAAVLGLRNFSEASQWMRDMGYIPLPPGESIRVANEAK